MATTPSNQLQATQMLSQIPFQSIIGGPLTAAVEAQAASAVACVKFVKDVGFDNDGAVRNVTFSFVKTLPPTAGSTTPTTRNMQITVPLLTIMPIPFIRIDTMTIAFKAQLSANTEASQTDSSSFQLGASAKASVGWGPFKAEFSGNVSSKKDSTATSSSKYSVEYTIDINVHAAQEDMPAGMAKILGILADAISANDAGAPAQAQPQPAAA
jgi:Protein of unknown function (DUF2589)